MSKKGIKVMQTIENEGDATSRVALKKTVQYTDVDKAWKNQIWENTDMFLIMRNTMTPVGVLLLNTETATFL